MTGRFTLPEQLEEVMRELSLRERVYGRMVQDGHMSQQAADFHLERMRAVADTLRLLIAQSWGTI